MRKKKNLCWAQYNGQAQNSVVMGGRTEESIGPPRRSPLFTLNYIAINDGYWPVLSNWCIKVHFTLNYIAINDGYWPVLSKWCIKVHFLDINAILVVSPVVVHCEIVQKQLEGP